jgi:hypothetical protein
MQFFIVDLIGAGIVRTNSLRSIIPTKRELYVNTERRGRVRTLLFRIREVPGSNLGPNTGYPD